MTEAEWLAGGDPVSMLHHVHDTSGPRKLRLMAATCCHQIVALLDERGRQALSTVERFADAFATVQELQTANRLAMEAFNEFDHVREFAAEAVVAASSLDGLHENTILAAWLAVQIVDATVPRPMKNATRRLTRQHQCKWLRDLFNPFRPIRFDPGWHTETVVSLAEAIYADRAFDRLPILADALQDAGCEDADILGHCRGPGPHVRGCWVVDLVLGKT